MPELNRRNAILMAGLGALAAAMHIADAQAAPSNGDFPLDRVPPPTAPPPGGYHFQDEFDGPAGSAPDGSKWEPAYERESMEDPTFWELPGNVGQYRDDRRNLFVDGKSNLVLRAAKDGNTYYSGKLFGKFRGGIGHTWEARIKLNCLTPGSWPAWYLANNSPDNGGEVDIMEWYGNGHWAAGTAVHAKLNGGEHVSQGITGRAPIRRTCSSTMFASGSASHGTTAPPGTTATWRCSRGRLLNRRQWVRYPVKAIAAVTERAAPVTLRPPSTRSTGWLVASATS